jgi:hypothetical protein
MWATRAYANLQEHNYLTLRSGTFTKRRYLSFQTQRRQDCTYLGELSFSADRKHAYVPFGWCRIPKFQAKQKLRVIYSRNLLTHLMTFISYC